MSNQSDIIRKALEHIAKYPSQVHITHTMNYMGLDVPVIITADFTNVPEELHLTMLDALAIAYTRQSVFSTNTKMP